ncbi:unnamed protein product [Anisakis simplex]|uniref:Uncharacterized protein n=1 Tax=Anisakis simplex TaxID=6269 RepID=A0A0M3JCE6_ANISI|nr:unnamed protein product [Anisakis simplex]
MGDIQSRKSHSNDAEGNVEPFGNEENLNADLQTPNSSLSTTQALQRKRSFNPVRSLSRMSRERSVRFRDEFFIPHSNFFL